MEGDSGVGEPGGAGVSETVSGEVRQAEVSNNLIPTGRITNGGRREETGLLKVWFSPSLHRRVGGVGEDCCYAEAEI